jgi:hypothetical protein
MSELFYDADSIDYPIIDSDAHVNESPDLWQARVPVKWKARAPKMCGFAFRSPTSLPVAFDE